VTVNAKNVLNKQTKIVVLLQLLLILLFRKIKLRVASNNTCTEFVALPVTTSQQLFRSFHNYLISQPYLSLTES